MAISEIYSIITFTLYVNGNPQSINSQGSINFDTKGDCVAIGQDGTAGNGFIGIFKLLQSII